jgi:cell division protein FtsL
VHRTVNLFLMMAALGCAFALYALKYDTRQLEIRVLAQERALEKAEGAVAVLRAERALLARPDRIEPLARALGLVPLGRRQYLRLDTSEVSGGEAGARETADATAAER